MALLKSSISRQNHISYPFIDITAFHGALGMKRSIIAFSSIIGIALAAPAQNATLVERGSETIVLCTDINFGGTCITWTQQSHCCKSGISIFEKPY